MSADIDRVKAIFLEAIGHDSPLARETYLELACHDSADVRQQVDLLLQVHDSVKSRDLRDFSGPDDRSAFAGTVEEGIAAQGGMRRSESSAFRDVIPTGDIGGRYRIIEVLGEGGMGIVCLAQQLQPVRRKVALKVIRLGMDSRRVLSRFEAERQALAMLDHPNIAKVFVSRLASAWSCFSRFVTPRSTRIRRGSSIVI
jgi:hypothetical protein